MNQYLNIKIFILQVWSFGKLVKWSQPRGQAPPKGHKIRMRGREMINGGLTILEKYNCRHICCFVSDFFLGRGLKGMKLTQIMNAL